MSSLAFIIMHHLGIIVQTQHDKVTFLVFISCDIAFWILATLFSQGYYSKYWNKQIVNIARDFVITNPIKQEDIL